MYKKSYSNLVHWLLFASLVASSVHLTAAQYRRDDGSSEESSKEDFDLTSGETTEEPNNTNKPFSIRSEFGSKRVLGISGSGDGAILILQDPQNIASQQWYIDGSDGWTIRSKLNDLCLKSKGPYPAMVVLGRCGRRGNKFVQTVDNQIEMLYKDDVCLDVSAGNETLGGYVMAKECDCSTSIRSNQKWSFDYTSNNVETVRRRINGRKNDKKSEESIEEPDTTDEDGCGWTSLEELELGPDPISARRRTIHRSNEEPNTSDEDSVESTEEPITSNKDSEECSLDESSLDCSYLLDESSEEPNTRKAMKKQRKNQDSEEGTEEPDINNDKPFTIQSEFGSKRVLGISESGDGANVILEDPQNTASQQWYIDSDGWTIRSKLNGLCLNSNGPNPAEVTVGPCGASGTHGSRRGKKFIYNHLSNQIENYKDDLCLDISVGNDRPGANVMAEKCHAISSNTLNQKWKFDYTTNVEKARKPKRTEDSEGSTEGPDTNNDKPFTIQSEFGSKRVLGISESGDGANVVLEDPQNTASQQWYIDNDGWTIRSKLNRLCLINYSNAVSPAEVTVGPCGASGAHGSRRGKKFVYNHLSNQIENYKDDVCLDISAGNDTLGANVMTTKCNAISSNKLNQKWSFDYTTNVEKAMKPKMTRMKKTLKPELFIIRTQMDSKMVVDAASKRNVASPTETSVGMNDYDKNAISQKWYIGADKTIRSALNDYCLISKGDFPVLVTMEPCAGSKRYTKWVYISDDKQIKLATNPSKCLELITPGCGNKHALGNLMEYHCHRSSNQKWTLEKDDSMV